MCAGSTGSDFVVLPDRRSVALASADVGITQMLSMPRAISRAEPDRPVWFVHGPRIQSQFAFAREVEDLIGWGLKP